MEKTIEELNAAANRAWMAYENDMGDDFLAFTEAVVTEFKPLLEAAQEMLQQVLKHSKRPEMDDAQFRMFARENINHLLYGSREGKKDE